PWAGDTASSVPAPGPPRAIERGAAAAGEATPNSERRAAAAGEATPNSERRAAAAGEATPASWKPRSRPRLPPGRGRASLRARLVVVASRRAVSPLSWPGRRAPVAGARGHSRVAAPPRARHRDPRLRRDLLLHHGDAAPDAAHACP